MTKQRRLRRRSINNNVEGSIVVVTRETVETTDSVMDAVTSIEIGQVVAEDRAEIEMMAEAVLAMTEEIPRKHAIEAETGTGTTMTTMLTIEEDLADGNMLVIITTTVLTTAAEIYTMTRT